MIVLLTAFDFLTGILVAAMAVIGAGALFLVARGLRRAAPAVDRRTGPAALAAVPLAALPAPAAPGRRPHGGGTPVTADPEDHEITRDLSQIDPKDRKSTDEQ